MALFTFGKKKKEDTAAPPIPPGPAAAPVQPGPAEQVIQLQQQGLSNDQIITTLQQQGFDNQSIMDSMQQVQMTHGVGDYPEPEPMHQDFGPPQQAQGMSKGDMEATVESIIEEKWKEFAKSHSQMTEWQETMNSRMEKMEQSVMDAKADLENLHKAIVGKIGEYDKSLIDVGTEIKAMEKVFQKVLPTLTENVAELSRITTTQRGSTPVKKPVKRAKEE